jgi:hypothetical protein
MEITDKNPKILKGKNMQLHIEIRALMMMNIHIYTPYKFILQELQK